MRKSTERKVLGRGAVVQALKSAANGITAIVQSMESDPPEIKELRGIIASIERAIEWHDIYKMRRPRLRGVLEKEKANITAIIQKFTELPITQEEKILAKHPILSGKISTSAGVAVPGGTVTIGGKTIPVKDDGTYSVADLPPGRHTLTYEPPAGAATAPVSPKESSHFRGVKAKTGVKRHVKLSKGKRAPPAKVKTKQKSKD
jgi:hypothetical protein